jgi:glycosyltransferase involved in cell wall biosynthesis
VPQSSILSTLRVGIVHDYLNQQGGAEKVAEVFSRMFPAAPVFTSIYRPESVDPYWTTVDVRTSFMQKLAPSLQLAKALLPLYPPAFESFDLTEFDVVISSASTFSKGVITRPETCHVCYCYSPSRFAWRYHEYVAQEQFPPAARALLPLVVSGLRVWDYAAAQRVDQFVGISTAVAERIEKHYRRPAVVVEPPVDLALYRGVARVGDFYLVMARLQSYKRIDLAVEACSRLGLRLKVAGDGPDRTRLESVAGPSVEFLGRVTDSEARDLLSHCLALLCPGEEDFGLAPVEAQASGRPVIAYRAGGALDTVIDGETGVFFSPQTLDALTDVLARFDPHSFEGSRLRDNAERFSLDTFKDRMVATLEAAYDRYRVGEQAGRRKVQPSVIAE